MIALNTFRRVVKHYELLKPDADCVGKHRLAFAKAHANELWQADTLFGPHVTINGVPVQTRLIAFIDGASRGCCHGQFFAAENVDPPIEARRAAFYKRGVPHALYVDNGSIYSAKGALLICARVGCRLQHTPVRDGAAKGMFERFFRRVRAQFLARKLNLSSLDALNRQFTHWVEESCNAQVHSILDLSPLDRFGWTAKRCASCRTDELFFVEEERHVRADNTFSFNALRFEAPRHLPERTIHLRFQRSQPTVPAIPPIGIGHW